MIFANDKISNRQMISILILDIFGTSIIVLPQKASILVNQNAWILVLITTLLALFSTYLITTLCHRDMGLNFYEQTIKNLTKPLAILVMLIFVLKNILVISYELSVFTSMTSQVLLPSRNLMMIFATMIIVSAYCALQGIEARARLSEILVILLISSLLLSLVIASVDADFTNVLPIQIHSDVPYLKYSLSLIFVFMGIDYLYLMYPYVSDKNKYKQSAMIAVGFLGVLMIAVTIIATANFNYVTLKEQKWPLLDMMNEVNFLGSSYFERQDALIMSFWIMGVFSSVTAGLYYSCTLIMNLLPKAKTNYVIGSLSIITFVTTDIFMGIEVNDKILLNAIIILMIFFLFIFPLISLGISRIRDIGQEDTEVESEDISKIRSKVGEKNEQS